MGGDAKFLSKGMANPCATPTQHGVRNTLHRAWLFTLRVQAWFDNWTSFRTYVLLAAIQCFAGSTFMAWHHGAWTAVLILVTNAGIHGYRYFRASALEADLNHETAARNRSVGGIEYPARNIHTHSREVAAGMVFLQGAFFLVTMPIALNMPPGVQGPVMGVFVLSQYPFYLFLKHMLKEDPADEMQRMTAARGRYGAPSSRGGYEDDDDAAAYDYSDEEAVAEEAKAAQDEALRVRLDHAKDRYVVPRGHPSASARRGGGPASMQQQQQQQAAIAIPTATRMATTTTTSSAAGGGATGEEVVAPAVVVRRRGKNVQLLPRPGSYAKPGRRHLGWWRCELVRIMIYAAPQAVCCSSSSRRQDR